MKLETLLEAVASPWHQAFIRFIETGEAEEEFLHYLDRDEGAQKAVDTAFSAQAAALERLAKALRESDRAVRAQARTSSAPERASEAIAQAFESVLNLPGETRAAVLTDAATTIARDVGVDGTRELRSALSDFERAVVHSERALEVER